MSSMQTGTIFYFSPVRYMTTRKDMRSVGVEEATRIEPPGPDWELVSVAIESGAVFFFWKWSSLTATAIVGGANAA